MSKQKRVWKAIDSIGETVFTLWHESRAKWSFWCKLEHGEGLVNLVSKSFPTKDVVGNPHDDHQYKVTLNGVREDRLFAMLQNKGYDTKFMPNHRYNKDRI